MTAVELRLCPVCDSVCSVERDTVLVSSSPPGKPKEYRELPALKAWACPLHGRIDDIPAKVAEALEHLHHALTSGDISPHVLYNTDATFHSRVDALGLSQCRQALKLIASLEDSPGAQIARDALESTSGEQGD